MPILLSVLRTLNEILTAGIAITAVSLLGYALTFNLRDRVARSFALILACVMLVFGGEALSGAAPSLGLVELWLKLEWFGLVFLPAAYLHFSDALLATTGKPSRGRRRWLVRLNYLLSTLFLLTLPPGLLIGGLVTNTDHNIAHLQRTPLTWVFAACYLFFTGWAWVNLWRAYHRTTSRESRRRMRYLLAGAFAPPIGSFPFLVFGADIAISQPIVIWSTSLLLNVIVFFLLIAMAYSVAFFGIPWPDRVVKRRLAKWLMRGPITAFVVLGVTTLSRRGGELLGVTEDFFTPVLMVVAILFMEHTTSIAAPIWERWFFSGGDRENLTLLQTLEERLLTPDDLRQFLESVLSAVTDLFQAQTAFVAAAGADGIELLVPLSTDKNWRDDDLSDNILEAVKSGGNGSEIYAWGAYWLLPLTSPAGGELIGILGVLRGGQDSLEPELRHAFAELGRRAALALDDWRLQGDIFSSLRSLTSQVDLIQRLRAASRYDRGGVLASPADLPIPPDFFQVVWGALTDYWGGPRLSGSPLMRFQIVQRALKEHGVPANALRAILKQAIEQVRPEGERRFTGEWILYNILEMKFMEGRRVREVALRLAMSEADLYRKQRIAIQAVADAILDMERKARAAEES
jgi:hypothetical protein